MSRKRKLFSLEEAQMIVVGDADDSDVDVHLDSDSEGTHEFLCTTIAQNGEN